MPKLEWINSKSALIATKTREHVEACTARAPVWFARCQHSERSGNYCPKVEQFSGPLQKLPSLAPNATILKQDDEHAAIVEAHPYILKTRAARRGCGP